MKPGAIDIQRLADDIYQRQWDHLDLSMPPREFIPKAVARTCFTLAKVFAEVAEEEFCAARVAADKERADAKLEEANR